MLKATLFVIMLLTAFAGAAPTAHPAYFETDPMLQVGRKEASSYAMAGSKRAHFETDPMLQVGRKEASSYAEV